MPRASMDPMVTLALGVAIGLALGLIVIGFSAIGSFDRGWDAALRHLTSQRLAQPRAGPAHAHGAAPR